MRLAVFVIIKHWPFITIFPVFRPTLSVSIIIEAKTWNYSFPIVTLWVFGLQHKSMISTAKLFFILCFFHHFSLNKYYTLFPLSSIRVLLVFLIFFFPFYHSLLSYIFYKNKKPIFFVGKFLKEKKILRTGWVYFPWGPMMRIRYFKSKLHTRCLK